MGLFDKLTGTKRPAGGVTPGSAEEVRAALLAVNRPDAPYVVRGGGVMVAQWRISEPAWQTFFIESRLTHAVRIRMRLVPEDHEVRALEEQWEVTRVGNPPRLAMSSEYSRGPNRTVSRHWTIERGDDGRLQATETFRFDGAALREPLRNAVLESGWTWRGVVFGTL
ncbi:hypothetical protein GCM10010503_34840 [Streptomyces lucensis JCM 4490]|uniref:Uncharacterized protein n=1 Tax=Streptomyces lucensis JCM 4490 TaxID=1306176 RepID=A0A918MSN4_9ACTN|nr:hypothetical protein [Streptomyces lucensis]GGW54917.1 hypothetical protein GCM10010503_34840 [Streptomyces lucensis JCM 4490]